MNEKTDPAKDLLRSSHVFWREATVNAIRADKGEVERWYFALLHLALATEHTLKAHLATIHPVLIRERIEDPKKTVSILGAVSRLRDFEIGGIDFSEAEERALKRAADLRNGIAHGQRFERVENVRSNFTYVMAFVRNYQFRQLGVAFQEVIEESDLSELMRISEQAQKFEERAKESLERSKEDFGTEDVFSCPECGNHFVSIEDELAVCHFCQNTDDVSLCENCDRYVPASELEEFSDEFDYWQGDGRSELENSFGYDFSKCCSACISEVRQDIRQKAYELDRAQYEEDMMMDAKR